MTDPEELAERKRARSRNWWRLLTDEQKKAIAAHRRELYMADPEAKAKRALVDLERCRVLRQRVIEAYGGRCVECGFDDWRALQVDHVHGQGRRSEPKSPTSYAYKLLRERESGNYRLICANCNWIKRYENGEHN